MDVIRDDKWMGLTRQRQKLRLQLTIIFIIDSSVDLLFGLLKNVKSSPSQFLIARGDIFKFVILSKLSETQKY